MTLDQKTQEGWMNKKWRPMMAWVYIVICVFDFIVAPILWSILQATYKGNVTEAWLPLTLQGAGLFHLAMGAILGVTAWSRGQEKMTMMSPPSSKYSSVSNRREYEEIENDRA